MTALDLPTTWVPIIVALVTVGGTVLGVLLAWLNGLSKRIRKLEHRDRLSWLYIRSLIDWGYRNAPGVPLPEPPSGWLEDDE